MSNTIDVPYKYEPKHIDYEKPKYETSGSVGIDLRADIPREKTIQVNTRDLIPTGLRIAVPEGFEAQVRPRSGLTLKRGVTVLNSPGTIDQDYRGDVGIIIANLGGRNYTIDQGERIAQLTLNPIYRFNLVDQPLDATKRDEGGFGSTGTN